MFVWVIDEHLAKIWKWLGVPDPSTNRKTAMELCHQGTGQWLLNVLEAMQWKQEASSFIWVHGICKLNFVLTKLHTNTMVWKAGCGKSILW